MSRNFGIRSPARRADGSQVWPMWAAAVVAIIVINAVMFLHNS
jgi:hypothetical protein